MTAPTDQTSSTEKRREEVKRRLRSSMLELIESQSFRDLRIESITSRAGLSRSAFYFYYKDKYELLRDVAGAAALEIYEQADTWWHGEGAPEELIPSALSAAGELYDEHSELLRLIFEVSTYEEDVGAFWEAVVGRFIEATADYIRRQQEAGRADRELDPEVTAKMMMWGIERVLYIETAVGGTPATEVLATVTPHWLRLMHPQRT